MTEVVDFSDERMEELMRKAEQRLREEERVVAIRPDEYKPFKFPQLDTGAIAKPHIKPAKHGATVLRKDSEGESEKNSSSLHMRKVEDPVMVRQRQTEVSHLSILGFLSMRKFIPTFP